jgi:hypothetical protein
MIKKILLWIVALFILTFVALWILGSGWQKIVVGKDHYLNPFKYHSVVDYLFGITNVAGESFKIPGTPSVFPHLEIGTTTETSNTQNQISTYQEPSATDIANEPSLTPQQKLDTLRLQYERLKQQAAQQNINGY